MEFIDELLQYFDSEPEFDVSELTDNKNEQLAFWDINDAQDDKIINNISSQWDMNVEDSENFLEVTQSIQHSLGDLADVETLENIDNYIDGFNKKPDSVVGLVNNIKGIYGEHEVYENLKSYFGEKYKVIREYATNAPDTDFKLFDSNGDLVNKLQVKVTDNPSYVLEARENLPADINIVTTDEAMEGILELRGEIPEGILGVDISNSEIEGHVERTINILSNREPEFDVLVGDPIISEYMSQGINPFEPEGPKLARKMYSNWGDHSPQGTTYSSLSSNFPGATVGSAWDASGFDGVGSPVRDAFSWTPQMNDTSCAVVTQRNIFESLTGESITEAEMSDYAVEKGYYDPEGGTPIAHLSSILRDKGFNCIDIIGAEFDEIKNALENGNKVIVGLDAREVWEPEKAFLNSVPKDLPDDIPHAVQVTGVDYAQKDSPTVILADPGISDGHMKAVPLKDFMNAWNDLGRVMTSVSPTRETSF